MARRKPEHPGTIFREEFLQPLKITVTSAAEQLGVTRKTLSEFLNERAGCSPDMAVRVGQATGTSPQMWLNMQTNLDLWVSSQKEINVIPFVPHNESSIMLEG